KAQSILPNSCNSWLRVCSCLRINTLVARLYQLAAISAEFEFLRQVARAAVRANGERRAPKVLRVGVLGIGAPQPGVVRRALLNESPLALVGLGRQVVDG